MGVRKRKNKTNSDSFDIDQLRQEWECDEHWEIRKNFITENQSKFDQDELVGLAQLYQNIQILGCTYAPEVMKKMEKLAQNLPERPRKRRKTFEEKAKKSKKTKKHKNSLKNGTGRTHLKIQPVVELDNEPEVVSIEPESEKTSKKLKKQQNQPQRSDLMKNLKLIRSTLKKIQKPEMNSVQLMNEVKTKCNLSLKWKYGSKQAGRRRRGCVMRLDGVVLSKGKGKNKKLAKFDSCQKLIANLEDQKWLRNLIPDQTSPFPDPQTETENTNEIDLKTIWKLVKKKEKILPDPVRLIEFVCVLNRHKVDWVKIPSNDVKDYCYLSINGNCVGKGKGGKTENLKTKAANNFLNKLQEDFGKQEKNTQTQFEPRPIPNFIIFQTENANPINILTTSADVNKKQLKFVSNEGIREVHLNGQVIAAVDEKVKMAKTEAALSALDFLRKNCYTIKTKVSTKPESVCKNDVTRSKTIANTENEIPAGNIGNKLLRAMGWTGGGLGKDGTGIKEPIKCSKVIGHRGFGLSNSIGSDLRLIYRRGKNILKNYAKSNETNDLVFTNEFTREERAIFHSMARKLGLKSSSKGSGERRYLTVCRKYTPKALFKYLIECGGSDEKYQLIPPGESL